MSQRSQPAGPPASEVRGSPGGIGRKTSDAAEAVSDALRRGDSAFLRRRRRVAGLSLAAMGSLGVVTAYQMGLLRKVPEPPVRFLDADRVDASGEAYQFLKTPDASLGLASAAVTLALAGMGSDRRADQQPLIPLALATKAILDAAFGLLLTLEQGTKHRRFCSWCLLAAATNVATVPQVLPEAAAAWRTLRRRG
ncbi:MAG: vitamin K epoxide reductase family protein [Acidimicrobiales bacterium]